MFTQKNPKKEKEGSFLNQQNKGDPFHIFTFLIDELSLVISHIFTSPKLLISNMLIFDVSTSQLNLVI